MKIIITIIDILILSGWLFCQSQDTIKWLNYSNNEIGISFFYPSFFNLDNKSAYLDSVPAACISLRFTNYPVYGNAAEMGMGDSTETLYLELEQSVDLVVSNIVLPEMAFQYGYLMKDGLWYDKEMYEKGWSDEPATNYALEDWNGYETYTPTRVYLKGGGCVTAAGERRRLFFLRKFSNNVFVYAFAERFDFDNADNILKKILISITITK